MRQSEWYMLFISCCLFSSLDYIAGFNLVPEHAHILTDPNKQKGSYFGYSVALQQVNASFGVLSRLIVGAPRGNSTYREHVNIYQPGVVYRCELDEDVTTNSRCSLLLLDPEGNTRHPAANNNNYEHMKDNAWIGGAIDVAPTINSPVVVCGPRWKNRYHPDYYLMNGICYSSDSTQEADSTADILLPLINRSKQAYRIPEIGPGGKHTDVFNFAYGQAGIAAHLTKNGNELMLGAPGLIDWTGSVIRYISNKRSYDKPHIIQINIPNPYFTKNVVPDDFFGYAVSSGNFFDNSKISYVAGAPRALQYRGKVLVYDYPSRDDESLIVEQELQGSQMGEYFGSSLCVVDLNNDGMDDLIVGAPLYSHYAQQFQDRSGDEGRVYVFMNNGKGRLTLMSSSGKEIMGSAKHGARFGTSIANLHDLNKDGFQDIAVGAPYEDNGRGAIYIYHGQKNGVKDTYKQRISASDVNSGIRSFGHSISNGMDIDNNYYNDIAVGAYDSGHAIIIKSRPIITIKPELTTDVRRISFNASEFRIAACIGYIGPYAPLSTDAVITVKIDPTYFRAYIINNDNQNVNTHVYSVHLQLNSTSCKKFDIKIIAGQQDFSKPIEVRLEFKLREVNEVRRKRQLSSPGFCKFCPMLDPDQPTYVTLRVPYATGCGEEDTCRTDLYVSGEFKNIVKPFIIGSSKLLLITVTALNRLEPAFLSRVQVTLPPDTLLERVPSECQYVDNTVSEDIFGSYLSKIVECDIGNPLNANSIKTLNLTVGVTNIPVTTQNLIFNITVLSAGEEQYIADNTHLLELQLYTKSEVILIGKTNKEQVIYSKQNDNKIEDAMLIHSYEVQNKGPSPIDKMYISFLVPVSVNSISFVDLYAPEAYLGDQPIICQAMNYNFTELYDNENSFTNIPQADSDLFNFTRRRKRALENNIENDKFLSSKIFHVNCNISSVGCINILCPVNEPFESLQTQAVFHIKLKVSLSSLGAVLEKKTAIVISTSGVITFQPHNNSLTSDKQRSSHAIVSTAFYGKVLSQGIETWIIVVSILGGLLILLLLIFALFKLGFFKRATKEELEALKNNDENDEDCNSILDGGQENDSTDREPGHENGIRLER